MQDVRRERHVDRPVFQPVQAVGRNGQLLWAVDLLAESVPHLEGIELAGCRYLVEGILGINICPPFFAERSDLFQPDFPIRLLQKIQRLHGNGFAEEIYADRSDVVLSAVFREFF